MIKNIEFYTWTELSNIHWSIPYIILITMVFIIIVWFNPFVIYRSSR
jgi:predicted ABC-type sugar transport system permease subunit